MRFRTVGLASLGALAAAAVWVALAMDTGLIFRFMPAGPPMAAAALVTWRRGRPTLSAAGAGIGLGAAFAVLAAILIGGLGRRLDDPIWTAAAVLVGVIIASVIAWRGGRAATDA
ncbi:MAG: hypothetical protein ABIO99_06715 [Candidatus Limnocylindria bacterium]